MIRYDRLGVGMSDRAVRDSDLTLDGEVATLRTLLDELELGPVSLLGGSCGSCTAIAFAAAFPERVERLVVYGSYPDGAAITANGVANAIVGAVRAHWGLGSRLLSDIFLGDADPVEHELFARLQREATSAENAAALFGVSFIASTYGRSFPCPRARGGCASSRRPCRARTGSVVRWRQPFQARRSSHYREARTFLGTVTPTRRPRVPRRACTGAGVPAQSNRAGVWPGVQS